MALPNPPLGPPEHVVTVFGPGATDEEFDQARDGRRFVLITGKHRSSATVADTTGTTYGWIRKGDLSDRLVVLLEAGKLFCVKHRGRLALYSSQGTAPPPPLPPASAEHVKSFYSGNLAATHTSTNTNKENTMNNFFARLINTNKKAATDAAVLEAGRIANNTLVKIIISRMPFITRFFNAKYLEGPVGKLVVANGALVLAQQLRPNDPRVRSLTEAMATQAYQETYQQIDIEGMIDQLLNLPEIKRAMAKLDKPADE